MNGATTPIAASTSEMAIANLDALGVKLAELGWTARLSIALNKIPSLYVQNPEPGADALQDHIYAAPRVGGWCYWWSFAEPIAEDAAAAAVIITRVLRSAG